jgi:peroxiredoxin
MKYICLILLLGAITMTKGIKAQESRSVEEAKGLEIGAQTPELTAIDQNGEPYSLLDSLTNGPVVIIFYRGQWCPICNRHLSSIQDSLPLILAKGASVIAISPEKQEYLNETVEKTGAAFTLLTDVDHQISDAFDLTIDPTKTQRIMYNTILGANLENAHTDSDQKLPIPATYIIGQDGRVLWRQFDPDYKKRSTVAAILEQL